MNIETPAQFISNLTWSWTPSSTTINLTCLEPIVNRPYAWHFVRYWLRIEGIMKWKAHRVPNGDIQTPLIGPLLGTLTSFDSWVIPLTQRGSSASEFVTVIYMYLICLNRIFSRIYCLNMNHSGALTTITCIRTWLDFPRTTAWKVGAILQIQIGIYLGIMYIQKISARKQVRRI